MSDIRSKCLDIFSRIMEVSPSLINDETNPENLDQWDSLTHVQMISELEKEFSIEIDPEEGIELESFKMVVEFLKKKIL